MRNNKLPFTYRSIAVIALLLFCFSWLLYANTVNHKFAFDDKSLIVDNSLLRDGTTLKEIFSTNYRYGVGFLTEGLYRPLVVYSYVLNATNNLDPRPFHIFNITINAFNGVLFFLLIYLLFRNVALGFISALVFIVHPLHTESVANIAGRPELMWAFFILLSWIIMEKCPRKVLLIGLGTLLYMLALFSKETAVVFPFMVFAVDYALKRPLRNKYKILKYSFLFSAVAFYLVLRWLLLGDTAAGHHPHFVNNPIFESPYAERLATALYVLLRYVLLLIFPARLSSDYSYNQLHIYNTPFHPVPLITLIFLAAAGYFFYRYRKEHREFGVACILFFLPYLLISNIILPIGTIMGERLMYVPAAGFSLAIGGAAALLIRRKRRSAVILTVILIVLFGIRTVTRNRDWRDDHTLFSADLTNAPNSVKVLCNMGFLSGARGDKSSGEDFYRRALDIYPDYNKALSGLGKNLYDQGRFPEALIFYRKTVVVTPDDAEARYDYGIVLEKLGRYEEAEHELRTAIGLEPHNPKNYRAMGNIKITTQQYDEALKLLQRALELGGDKRIIYNNLAAACFYMGNYRLALSYVEEAGSLGIRIHPGLVKSIRDMLRAH